MLLLQGRKRPVEALAFHPGGARLAVAGGPDDPVEFWDVATRTLVWTGPGLGYHLADHLRFDPTGRWLFAAGGGKGFFVVDARTGDSTRVDGFRVAHLVAAAPAGDCVVVADTGADTLVAFGLNAKGLGARRWRKSLRGRRPASRWDVDGLAFLPDGKRFATVESRRLEGSVIQTLLRTRSAKDGRILDETVCECACGWQLAISPDGVWTAFNSLTHLLAFHATDPAASVNLRAPNRKHITGLAFHPSSRHLAVTSNDKMVRLHDVRNEWTVTRTFDWDIGKLKSVAFSPDGTLAAAGGEKGQVVVWDVDV